MPDYPVVTFRVYPKGRRGFFYRVNVWEKSIQMRRHLRTWCRAPKDTLGMCSTYRIINSSGRWTPILGEINLLKGHLTTEILAHEFMHATLDWARTKGLNIAEHKPTGRGVLHHEEDEELACYAHGRMFQQAVNRFWREGLL